MSDVAEQAKKRRIERSLLWAIIAVVVSGIASFALSVTFAQHAADNARKTAQQNAEKFTQQWCSVVVILDNVYQSQPQTKMTQQQKDFVGAMHKLRTNLRCDDK